jgi:hypothetical protein
VTNNTVVATTDNLNGSSDNPYKLAIYYDLETYKILFYNGVEGKIRISGIAHGTELHSSDTVKYTESTSGGVYGEEKEGKLGEIEPIVPDEWKDEYEWDGNWYTEWDPNTKSGKKNTEITALNGYTMPADNLVLYAGWVKKKYTATFHLVSSDSDLTDSSDTSNTSKKSDKDVTKTVTFTYNSNIEVPADQQDNPYWPFTEETAKLHQYEFAGWQYYVVSDTDSSGNSIEKVVSYANRDDEHKPRQLSFELTKFSTNVDIYAKWETNINVNYTVKYKLATKTSDGKIVPAKLVDGNAVQSTAEDATEIAQQETGKQIAGEYVSLTAKFGDALNEGFRSGYYPMLLSPTDSDSSGGNASAGNESSTSQVTPSANGDDANGDDTAISMLSATDGTATEVSATSTSLYMDINSDTPIEYTFYYVSGASTPYVVRYLEVGEVAGKVAVLTDADGNPVKVAEDAVHNDNTESVVTENALTIEGYDLTAGPGETSYSYQITRILAAYFVADGQTDIDYPADNVITFYYVKDTANTTYKLERWLQTSCTKADEENDYTLGEAYTLDIPGIVGTEVEATETAVTGYRLNEAATAEWGLQAGTVPEQGETLTLKLFFDKSKLTLKKNWDADMAEADRPESVEFEIYQVNSNGAVVDEAGAVVNAPLYEVELRESSFTITHYGYENGVRVTSNIENGTAQDWAADIYLPLLEKWNVNGSIVPDEGAYYAIYEVGSSLVSVDFELLDRNDATWYSTTGIDGATPVDTLTVAGQVLPVGKVYFTDAATTVTEELVTLSAPENAENAEGEDDEDVDAVLQEEALTSADSAGSLYLSEHSATLVVTNHPTYELPKAGGGGGARLYAAGAALIASAGAAVWAARHRHRRRRC